MFERDDELSVSPSLSPSPSPSLSPSHTLFPIGVYGGKVDPNPTHGHPSPPPLFFPPSSPPPTKPTGLFKYLPNAFLWEGPGRRGF